MAIFKIHHITKYEYDNPVMDSVNEIRIFPYACAEQELLQLELTITQTPDVYLFRDYWGNKCGQFSLVAPHRTLMIASKAIIRTTLSNQLQIEFHSDFNRLHTEVANNLDLIELTYPDQISNQWAIDQIVDQLMKGGGSVATVVEKCCEYIYKRFKYVKGITTIETTVDEILEHESGVCQDFAHLMLQVLRTMGIPSRYVSGYICPNKNGMRGEGATHAWVEAYIPGYGWAGIDPTNNVWVTNTHVKLAIGRNFNDCSPVKGTFRGNTRQHLSVYVSVGYEDGHVFEDTNAVKQEPLLDTQAVEASDHISTQQQQ
ncbi:Transglutaminase-like enzyme, putative cysteine protease [Parapedobacter luteus]|uniref:Transglutaminase-like enzyme, putative cysteine protease n=1 Tax=Parapedobacter luteus TaxID=623280 RepID=A0A1T5EEG9_9SPHI|nr:transglutaminase family protein [Parapedobacter luteus]SKB82382.1 Transglutaminase-like enzyme, putative cysteine protease [Parapedobacter luteus]